MKSTPKIEIWPGCSDTLVMSIRDLEEHWKPYSSSSRRYPILKLMAQMIDPAIAKLCRKSSVFSQFIPGAANSIGISELVRHYGFSLVIKSQRLLLRQFVATEGQGFSGGDGIVATLESLIEVVWACGNKRPVRSACLEGGATLNAQREQGRCKFCGQPTEFSNFISANIWPSEDDPDFSLALRLSSRYCSGHRPRYPGGGWNSSYRRAKRSQEQFEIELSRLTQQSARLSKVFAQSGNVMADLFIHTHVSRQALQPADEAELRSQARLMADTRLTDSKKQMLMLRASGYNQSEIAKAMGISRQAVSKALASIPSVFRLDFVPEHPAH
ncbi:LuxR family transcriptional regulator [Pseudomonas grimontii]|uniref:LuxR family transcriptional regulator n=1 Tax=Pseudomonas grimontii TaxID=129847 RepID=UPI00387B77E6